MRVEMCSHSEQILWKWLTMCTNFLSSPRTTKLSFKKFAWQSLTWILFRVFHSGKWNQNKLSLRSFIFLTQKITDLYCFRCKFRETCKPYENYVKINPNTQLNLIGNCESGCEAINRIDYLYNVYKYWSFSVNYDFQEKWLSFAEMNTTKGVLLFVCL
jgi:hypothetical protein